MVRPSPFEPRRASSSTQSKVLSNKSTTVRTREYEHSLTGLRAALLKADKAASVARSRARKAICTNSDWLLSAQQQGPAIEAAVLKINLNRDEKKKRLTRLWKEQGGTVELSNDQMPLSSDKFELAEEDQSEFDEDDVNPLESLNKRKRDAAWIINDALKERNGKLMELLNELDLKGTLDEEPYSGEEDCSDDSEDSEWSDSQAEEDPNADDEVSE